MCAAAFAIVSSAAADYRAEYREGVRAFEKSNWKEAARRMRAAIQENPSEGEQILLYGTRRPKYVPHLYLAAALARAGDCGGAVTALDRSEQQAQSTKTREYRELAPVVSPCRKQSPAGTVVEKRSEPDPPAGPDPAVLRALQNAAGVIERAQNQQRALQTLKSDATVAGIHRQSPQLREAEASANNDLQAANAALGRARTNSNPAEAQHAITLANGAAAKFESLHGDLGRRREAALQTSKQEPPKKDDLPQIDDARRAQARIDLSRSVAAARSLFGSLGGGSEPLNRASRQLHQAIGPADAVSKSRSSSLEEIGRARATLDGAVRIARQALAYDSTQRAKASQSPPAPLLDGVNAFFRGDYKKAVGVLGSSSFSDTRADAQARLFAAAARYSLWVLSGRKDPQLLKLAAADVKRAKSLDMTLLPSASYFSPRFIAFFTEQR